MGQKDSIPIKESSDRLLQASTKNQPARQKSSALAPNSQPSHITMKVDLDKPKSPKNEQDTIHKNGSDQVVQFGNQKEAQPNQQVLVTSSERENVSTNSALISEKLSNSRIQLRKNREAEIQRVLEEEKQQQQQQKQQQLQQVPQQPQKQVAQQITQQQQQQPSNILSNNALNTVLAVLEKNQNELIEIIDERVKIITNEFEGKLIHVENKVDAIAETLFEFEQHFSERSLVDGDRVSTTMRESIDSLRNEVKAMVALSERYINSESKINSMSLLGKTILKENKQITHQQKPRNPEFNPYYEKRERSKMEKQLQDSSILRDFDGITKYSPYFNENAAATAAAVAANIAEDNYQTSCIGQNQQQHLGTHTIPKFSQNSLHFSSFFNSNQQQQSHIGSSNLLD